MKVLVVDDNSSNLYYLETLLKSMGYEVDTAENGAQAYDKLLENKFEMVITDILMPVMDGFMLCLKIRNNKQLEDTIIIFYTATYTTDEDKKFSYSIGVDKYLIKPIDPEELMKEISTTKKRNVGSTVDKVDTMDSNMLTMYNERLINKLDKKILDLEHEIEKRKNAEADLLRMNEQLYRIDKMNTINKFAAGLVHDLRNMLMVIVSSAEIIKIKVKDDTVQNEVNALFKTINVVKELLNKLVSFKPSDKSNFQILNVNDVFKTYEKDFTRILDKNQATEFDLGSELWSINCDPNQLYQLILNLMINAQESIGPDGKINVKTENVELDSVYEIPHFEMKSGHYVRLSIRDNGSGISKDVLDNIFDPFFTTKDFGTGLGLTIIYNIILQHDGFIMVESEKDVGTTFLVYFPVKEV